MPREYRCPECGSNKIQGTAWIDLNSNTITDLDPPGDDYYCPDCDETGGAVCEVDKATGLCEMHTSSHGEACKPRVEYERGEGPLVECVYCHKIVPVLDKNPKASNDDAWAKISKQHTKRCSWAVTRAFQRVVKGA